MKKKNKLVNCCKSKKTDKKCRRKKDNKLFELPRKYPKKKCLSKKIKGFTMRASCAPYLDCTETKNINKS